MNALAKNVSLRSKKGIVILSLALAMLLLVPTVAVADELLDYTSLHTTCVHGAYVSLRGGGPYGPSKVGFVTVTFYRNSNHKNRIMTRKTVVLNRYDKYPEVVRSLHNTKYSLVTVSTSGNAYASIVNFGCLSRPLVRVPRYWPQ